MFFTEKHDRGLGLVAHAPFISSDVRFQLKKLLQRTIYAAFFVGFLNKNFFVNHCLSLVKHHL